MAGTVDINAGHDYYCVLQEMQLSVESLSVFIKVKTHQICVLVQGLWGMAGGEL